METASCQEIYSTSMLKLLGNFLLLVCLASSSTVTTKDRLPNKFFGAWRLVAVEGEPPGLPGFYDRPTGLIVYDPSGWMSVQIANRSNRKPFAAGYAAGTTQEKAAAFDSYFAYYGTWTVDNTAGTVTHHLEDFSYPNLRHSENVRWFESQGNDRLILIPVEDGKGGAVDRKEATYRLIWERIK
jgi:hypothetical protein